MARINAYFYPTPVPLRTLVATAMASRDHWASMERGDGLRLSFSLERTGLYPGYRYSEARLERFTSPIANKPFGRTTIVNLSEYSPRDIEDALATAVAFAIKNGFPRSVNLKDAYAAMRVWPDS